MILLVGLYLDANAARRREFLTCIERNAGNATIAGVHVFVEQEVDPVWLAAAHPQVASPKVRLVGGGGRVTFGTLFAYANRELPGRRVIVANADIFFDQSLACLDDYELTGRLLCLSRWDVLRDGTSRLHDFEYSQDAWIFQAPIVGVDADFHLGVPRCDNRLAWEAQRAGLVLSNPSRSIRAHHLHLTGVRRYGRAEALAGPIRGVAPEFLETVAVPRKGADRIAVNVHG